jgi:hypothetical protein
MGKGVDFQKFLNTGEGLLKKSLGFSNAGMFVLNAVEIQFSVTRIARQNYKNLRPAQWSGPESIWLKKGSPLSDKWENVHSGPGTGSDDPLADNILLADDVVAYYDAPGPNVTKYLNDRPSWIHVVQNFTGWVVGESVRGGQTENLCDAAAWHSVISVVDQNWAEKDKTPFWQKVLMTRSGTGWADIMHPPQFH